MTPADRAELEARAEKAIRRGEMSEALGILEQLSRAFPEDTWLANRVSQLKENVDPRELARAPAPRTDPHGHQIARPASPEQEGERLFALGDYAGAAAAYRRALKDKPDSELIRERLFELYKLAQTAPRHSPTDGALPAGKEPMLRALLDRISARKRVVLG